MYDNTRSVKEAIEYGKGFSAWYREYYLHSDHWKNMRAAKTAKGKPRCGICAKTSGIDLHHLFYRGDLYEAQTSDLRWLCRRCHKLAHEAMDEGLLAGAKEGNHHSLFALTKHHVKIKLKIPLNQNLFKKSL